MGTLILMVKATIGIGVLAIPFSFQTVGLIPGVILLTFIIMIVTWSDHVVGTFKQNHPDVYSLPDVGRVLFGRPGEIFFFFAFLICEPPHTHTMPWKMLTLQKT